jgi:hypothetical protein
MFTGPNIVRNGLVLHLDAANTKSYASGSTTWFDKSGNGNNGTLTNGPTFSSLNGGSIVFDGSNDYVTRGSSLNTGQNITVSCWMKAPILGSTRRGLVANSYNYGSGNGWFLSTGSGTNTFFFSIGSDNAYRVAANTLLNINQWYYLSATCINGGSLIELFINGIVIPSYGVSLLTTNTVTYNHNQLNIGYRNIGATLDPFTGNIASVQIYNRALTAQEILQNYNATKSRFDL